MTYAVVLGSADCLFEDHRAIAEWCDRTPVVFIAINDAGWVWPDPIDHWASLHAEHFPEWQRKRLESGAKMQYETWSRPKDDGVKTTHRIAHWGVGSSGLFGVTVAFHLNIDRVVLCGVPLESRPHVVTHGTWGTDKWPSNEVNIHRPGWVYWADRMEGRVKSCSGWTRELLGEPEEEWLYA